MKNLDKSSEPYSKLSTTNNFKKNWMTDHHKKAFDWFKNNIEKPFINNSAVEVANTGIDAIKAVDSKLSIKNIKPFEVKPAKAYSVDWFAQNLSGGVGAVLPYLVAGSVTDLAIGGSLDSLGVSYDAQKLARTSQILGAGLWGLAAHPVGGQSRVANSISSMAGFGLFDLGNSIAAQQGLLGKIALRSITGAAGGGLISLSNSIIDNRPISLNQLSQSAVMGFAMNSLMPSFDKVDSAKIDSSPKPESDLSYSQYHDNLAKLYESRPKTPIPQYPDPADYHTLTSSDISQLGFATHDEIANLRLEDLHKGPRPLPNPKIVASEVGKLVQPLSDVTNSGSLKIGEFNMEFLDAKKATYFSDSYKQILPKLDLLFGEEVNEGGLRQIAQDTGYKYYASRANSRGQGVGFLVNPNRIDVSKVTSYDNVSTIDGVPDERPAFRIDFTDKATGEKSSAIVVHLKSMMGGVDRTSKIRFDQATTLANDLEPNFKGIIAGDFNTFLDHTTDTKALTYNGFELAFKNDSTPTQIIGGRLDGFYLKGFSDKPQNYQVIPFFRDPQITRALSDHALTIMEMPSLK